MAEVALISARKSKLTSDAANGSRSAAEALRLQSEPDRFLSTIQIGITLIGILTGLYSGASLSTALGQRISELGIEQKTALTVARVTIVVVVTYLSIVVGELVPKRIGMCRADAIARSVAAPMRILSMVSYPVVWLLSVSTSLFVRLFRLKEHESKVTEEEIRSLIKEGTDSGEVQEVEQDIMQRALMMGDSRIESIMTCRKEVVCLTTDMNEEEVRNVLTSELHSAYPVLDKDKGEVCGVISMKRLVLSLGRSDFDIAGEMCLGLCLPETMTAYGALETFKKSHEDSALVYDEYGNFQGIITLRDILDGLVGNIAQEGDMPMIVKQGDADCWIVDGQCPVYDFLDYFDCENLYEPSSYATISGLIMESLKRMPVNGDVVTWHAFRIEVKEMDHVRIASVAVTLTRS